MKKNFKKSIRNALALILCVITVILSFCSCSSDKNGGQNSATDGSNSAVETIGSGKTLSLKDYLSSVRYFTEYGEDVPAYSNIASAEIEFDYIGLKEDIGEKGLRNFFKNIRSYDDEEIDYRIESMNIDDIFEVKLKEDYKNLSNGDIITVEITNRQPYEDMETILNALGISIEKELNITVEGLKQAKELDFFQNFEQYIVSKGPNGAGFITTNMPEEQVLLENTFYMNMQHYGKSGYEVITHDNVSLGGVSYYAEDPKYGRDYGIMTTGLENVTEGQSVTFYIKLSDELKKNLLNLGYVPAETDYVTTVPDLGEYITTKDQLTSEDVKKIEQAIITEITRYYKAAETEAVYFASVKPGKPCDAAEKNMLIFVFNRTGTLSQDYCFYTVSSVIKTRDGILGDNYKISDYAKSADTLEETEALFNTDFTYEKLF